MIIMSQQLLLLPQLSPQELPPRIPPFPFPQHDKRMIIHNQLQELFPQEFDTQPQELLLLHPQLAADKSLIEIASKSFVMLYIMYACLAMFP